MTEEKKLTPQERYQKEKMKVFSIKLHREYDRELISIIEKYGNANGLIRKLLEYYADHPDIITDDRKIYFRTKCDNGDFILQVERRGGEK